MSDSPWRSDFLFARPTFVEGLARILDWGGSLSEFNRSGDADQIAIAMDWRMVGADLRTAITEQLQLPFTTTA